MDPAAYARRREAALTRMMTAARATLEATGEKEILARMDEMSAAMLQQTDIRQLYQFELIADIVEFLAAKAKPAAGEEPTKRGKK